MWNCGFVSSGLFVVGSKSDLFVVSFQAAIGSNCLLFIN